MDYQNIRRSRGFVATIDYLFIFPVFMFFLILMVNVGTFFYTRMTLVNAAHVVMRQVAIASSTFSVDTYTDQVLSQLALNPSEVTETWYANGVEIDDTSVINQPVGTMLSLHMYYVNPNPWNVTQIASQTVRVIGLKEGGCAA